MNAVLTSAVIASILASILSANLTYVYTGRTRKKKLTNEALANLASAGRAYRNYYMRMVEHDIDFSVQQQMMAAALKAGNDKAFDVHREAAKLSQRTALDHQDNVLRASTKLFEASYVLAAFLNKQVRKYKLQDEINRVIGFILKERTDFDEAKKEIDDGLLPHLKKVETICNRLLWEQNASWLGRGLSKWSGL